MATERENFKTSSCQMLKIFWNKISLVDPLPYCSNYYGPSKNMVARLRACFSLYIFREDLKIISHKKVLGCMGCSNEWKSKDNVASTVKKTLSVIINAHYLRACGLFFRSNTVGNTVYYFNKN